MQAVDSQDLVTDKYDIEIILTNSGKKFLTQLSLSSLINKKIHTDIFSAKKRIRKILPQYMIPKRLFVLPNMPLNISGKVDRLKVKQTINKNILKK